MFSRKKLAGWRCYCASGAGAGGGSTLFEDLTVLPTAEPILMMMMMMVGTGSGAASSSTQRWWWWWCKKPKHKSTFFEWTMTKNNWIFARTMNGNVLTGQFSLIERNLITWQTNTFHKNELYQVVCVLSTRKSTWNTHDDVWWICSDDDDDNHQRWWWLFECGQVDNAVSFISICKIIYLIANYSFE